MNSLYDGGGMENRILWVRLFSEFEMNLGAAGMQNGGVRIWFCI